MEDIFQSRIRSLLSWLSSLLSQPFHPFDEKLRSILPNSPGVYRIIEVRPDRDMTLRVGRTKTAGDGLRQRVYQNHYMGNQHGNIRQQLIKDGRCKDLNEAKEFLKQHCKVQFLVINEDNERKWVEHFLLGVLRPHYSD